MLNVESAKLTGKPGAEGWAQVYDFEPEETDAKLQRGHLFAVISTSKIGESGEVNTLISGRELTKRLNEEYFGDLTIKPFNALKNAVEKVTAEFTGKWGDVEIAASAYLDGIVYSAAGGGKVMIAREGATGTILESKNAEVIASSGFPKVGDMVLMATGTFFKDTSQDSIRTALAAKSCEDAVEIFAPGIRASQGSGRLGAVVIKFSEDTFETKQKEKDPESPAIKESPIESVRKRVMVVVGGLYKKFPQKTVYVKSDLNDEVVGRSKKTTFSVAIILILLLVVSVGLGVRQKKMNDVKSQYAGLLVAAENDVDQAIGLASVNPDQSRALFLDSEQKLNQILALKVKDPKIDDLKKKIDDSRAVVLGEYIASPQLFLDLTLLSSGFHGDTVSVSGGNIYILDKTGRKIVSVAIDTKKSMVVAGPTTINNAFDLAAYEKSVYILGSDGIYEVDSGYSKVIDKTWSGDAFIKAFAGNIYVLDKNGNSIYRYIASGSTFNPQQSWLVKGAKVDFSDASSWSIDGAVYVLFPNSKILKFSQGSPQNFYVTGVNPEIGSIDAIYADADNSDIYFLDRAGGRVVVTDKKGKYIAQYLNSQISNAVNLVVSEVNKKIILLTGDKLLSIDMKHLQ